MFYISFFYLFLKLPQVILSSRAAHEVGKDTVVCQRTLKKKETQQAEVCVLSAPTVHTHDASVSIGKHTIQYKIKCICAKVMNFKPFPKFLLSVC